MVAVVMVGEYNVLYIVLNDFDLLSSVMMMMMMMMVVMEVEEEEEVVVVAASVEKAG